MCVIVDANVAALALGRPPAARFAPVVAWLTDTRRRGRLVYGGHLARELQRVGEVNRFVLELVRAGRAVRIGDEAVALAKRGIPRGVMTSDDPHVIALARASGARTLCSDDQALIDDFKDRRLIANPRGCVYRTKAHQRLLVHTRGCPGRDLG